MFSFFFFKKFFYNFFFQKLVFRYRYYSLPPREIQEIPAEENSEIVFENQNNNNIEELVDTTAHIKHVLWVELDRDALGEIMSQLCAADQARFHAVCKAFRSAHPTTTPKSLPWFVSVDRSLPTQTLIVELYDPSSTPGPTSVHKISLAESGIPISTRTRITTIHNNGWLFMSIGQEGFFRSRKYFLIYSPLTKQLIQLPPYYSVGKLLHVVTSSSDPSSPDCIFLIAETGKAEDKPIFRTICHGDKEWTARGCNRANLVSSIGPQSLSYNNINGEFKFENITFCNDLDEDLEYIYGRTERYMLNGELIFLKFRKTVIGKGNNRFPVKPWIKKYDYSRRVLLPVRSLGDQTLFISENCSGVARIGKEVRDDNGVLPNKIYYFFYGGCIIYSFENGDLVEFRYHSGTTYGIITTCLPDSGDLLEFKYNSGIRYWDKTKAFFWFNPPMTKLK